MAGAAYYTGLMPTAVCDIRGLKLRHVASPSINITSDKEDSFEVVVNFDPLFLFLSLPYSQTLGKLNSVIYLFFLSSVTAEDAEEYN
ncbi:hypothetical protein J6590_007923 [Homalodisca vitripennis]|nr:hypothetical protein J6590_007923 [Homalodisca vitripennis]